MLLLFFSSLHVQHPMTHMETHQRILALLLVILVKIRFASPVHLQRDIIQFLTQPNQTRLCECITESLYIPFYAVNSRSLCHLELLLLLLLTTKFSCSCYPKNWRIILHARTVLRTVLRGKEVIIHFFFVVPFTDFLLLTPTLRCEMSHFLLRRGCKSAIMISITSSLLFL